MVRTVRDALVTAMEELTEKSLKKFRNKLNDWKIEEGFSRIPRGKLEKADEEDIVNLILNYYMESYGPELVVDVLNDINEKKVALELREDLEGVSGFTWRKKPKEEPQSGAASSPASIPQVVTFVDKHREALIARCSLVAPILDGLLSKELLIDEDYDVIMAEKTSQDRMRKLYMVIRGWSASNKQTLYEILKEKNRNLIEDLE